MHNNNKTFSLFYLLMMVISPLTWAKAETPLPNIILFLVDDMGLMDTSVPFITDQQANPVKQPLNDWYRTPNMAKLSNMGIRYNQFYAHSVCSPSRTSILTGQNGTRHHTTQWIDPAQKNSGQFAPEQWNWLGLNKQHITLPKLLKEQGYHTIFVGKAHLGPLGSVGEEPLNLGFDVNIGGAAFGAPGSYLGEKNYKRNKKNVIYQVPHLEKYHGTDTFLTEALTLEANAAMATSVKNKKPFFLEVSHYAVHSPFTADKRFIEHYSNNKKFPEQAKRYASMVEGMDKSLGDIMKKVTELGIADNTLIMFLGDNGSDAPIAGYHDIASSAPLRGRKGTHYEGGMRVPFLAAWLKANKNNTWQQKLPIAQGVIQGQVASVNDIYPTISGLLGIDQQKLPVTDGYSLQTSLTNQYDVKKPANFLMHFPHEHRSSYFTVYREGNWKLIYHYFPALKLVGHRHTNYNPNQLRYELYNLANDPSEQQNLAKTQSKQLQHLLTKMKKQLKAENAQLPKGVTYQNIN